jgi:DNA-binding transcriptional LysR family regulator
MQESTLNAPLDWDNARMFLAVARAGQMLGAARLLGLNQATLSRRMAALEAAIGAKLLARRTHGTELTDAGVALLETLERVETEMLAVQARLQGAEAAAAGVVRIGAPDGFGVGFLAPRLSVLAERHPALTVQIVPTPRGFSLSRREADLAVMVGRPDKGRLVARKLTDYTLGLYASPAYLADHSTPGEAADLTRHRLVGYVEDLIAAPLNYTAEFLRGWQSRIELTSAVGQLEAVRAGAGIGVLHDYLARQPREAGKLVRLLPNLQATRSYWLAIHENLRDVARVRVAADFIIESVREAQGLFLG